MDITELLANSALAGLAVSAIITLLTWFNLANNTAVRRVAAVILSVIAGIGIAATRDGVKFESIEDIVALSSASLAFATTAFVFFADKLNKPTT